MAYRRRRVTRRPRLRAKRRSTTKTARRRVAKTGRRISRKRVLNLVSRKKRDSMMAVSYVSPFGSSAAGGIVVNASDRYWAFGWIATARSNMVNTTTGTRGSIFDTPTRTASNPYMVGLKERIRLETSTGRPFVWRRICFTFKGTGLVYDHDPTSAFPNVAAHWFHDGGIAGMMRALTRLTGGTFPGTETGIWNQLRATLFRGAFSIDWDNPIIAPTNNQRVRIHYDRTTTIRSGNEEGTMKVRSVWHPMRKRLMYDDIEYGGEEIGPYLSTSGRFGMGDYYVIDIFDTGVGGSGDDQLSFVPEATLYWHE